MSRAGSWTRRKRRAAVIFLAPLLLVVGALVLVPIVQTTWTSLYSEDGSRFVGLANYVDLVTSPQTRRAIGNNLVWVVVAPTVVTVLGLLFAVLTGESGRRPRSGWCCSCRWHLVPGRG